MKSEKDKSHPAVDGIVAHNVADLIAAEDEKSGADIEKEEKSLKPRIERKCLGETDCPRFIYLLNHNMS